MEPSGVWPYGPYLLTAIEEAPNWAPTAGVGAASSNPEAADAENADAVRWPILDSDAMYGVAIEVARDPAGGWGARKADLIKKNGLRVPLWRYTDREGRWNWAPGKGWRESTASTHITPQPALDFRLMGALFGFAERLAVALDMHAYLLKSGSIVSH